MCHYVWGIWECSHFRAGGSCVSLWRCFPLWKTPSPTGRMSLAPSSTSWRRRWGGGISSQLSTTRWDLCLRALALVRSNSALHPCCLRVGPGTSVQWGGSLTNSTGGPLVPLMVVGRLAGDRGSSPLPHSSLQGEMSLALVPWINGWGDVYGPHIFDHVGIALSFGRRLDLEPEEKK